MVLVSGGAGTCRDSAGCDWHLDAGLSTEQRLCAHAAPLLLCLDASGALT